MSLPAIAEADAILAGAQTDAGFERMLKFKKGKYTDSDGLDVPMGTKFIAHAVGYTKCWIKFVNQEFVEKHMYRVNLKEVPPDRDQLDDNDPTKWPIGISGGPSDPWVLQSILPLEDERGELMLFVASSFGGKRAVADVCRSYALRTKRTNTSEQPIIVLKEATMPTKRFGPVPRPFFEIVGWDRVTEGVREVRPANESLKEEMNDDIPF